MLRKDRSGWIEDQSFRLLSNGWLPKTGISPLLKGRGCRLVSAADWSSVLDGGTWMD